MQPSLIASLFLINSIVCQTTTSIVDENECECITKWTATDIECSSSDINILQSYLALTDIHCLESCHENTQCQQAFSLLTQYYHYCPLSTVSQDLISSFHTNSTCILCDTPYTYNNQDITQCLSTNCTDTQSINNTKTSIDYIESNCFIDNDTNSDNDCPFECQHSWNIISSFQRQCALYPLDDLYTPSSLSCTKDCSLYDDEPYQPNCLYTNYSKLDIKQLEQQTQLCFYGLNIDEPTSYDLICIQKSHLHQSGIISYSALSETQNESFWSSFGIAKDMDLVWILCAAAMVFFMQLGFTLLEAGSVKAGNVQNILFKNVMDAAICALVYWVIGYCVAYGDSTSPDANGFMGVENILIEDEDWGQWFFQMSFACTASTIVSGAVAERMRLEPYFIYTIIVSAWIYPIVVHWIWSDTGWLSPYNNNPSLYAGAIDFAGSSCVHMIGGIVGLCGAYFVGPRLRRFDKSQEATSSKFYAELMHQFEFGHNVPFQVLGLFILWFGFYGFNPGSTLKAQHSMDIASKVAVNTTLSAAAGGLTSAFLARITTDHWHIPRLCNGLLAALASITASCAVVSSGWAILIGIIGSLLYCAASRIMVSSKVQIDDPLDAFAVHAVGGTWGVLSAALFSTSESLKAAGYPEALYEGTTVWERIATNLVLIVFVGGWAAINSIVLFGFMGEKILNILRVTEDAERVGIDIKEHGGSAVNMRRAYAVPVQSTIHTGRRYHATKSVDESEEEVNMDGKFANKVRESSLEKRLGNIAESDEDGGVFPT